MYDFKSNIPSQIKKSIQIKTYHKNEDIIPQGTHNEYLYFIESGIAEVCTNTNQGQKISITIFQSGETFGILEILDSKLLTQNVIALTDCVVYKIHQQDILSWMKNDFEFTMYIIGLLQTYLYKASNLARSLQSMTIKERVVTVINHHRLNDTLKYLSKDILIHETGTQRRTLNRVLTDLYEDGVLRYKNKTFEITNATYWDKNI